MMRSNVVLPEPLSPRMVRNSPSAISSETFRSTVLRPKAFATLRMLSNVDFAAGSELVVAAEEMIGAVMNRFNFSSKREVGFLLCRLHIVPNLVVLCAPRHVLPEINVLLIIVD